MSGRLGIDFGTSNTVLAVWDSGENSSRPLHIPDYGFEQDQSGEIVSTIPSLIHYASGGRILIGKQVFDQDLSSSPRTLRWMKRYIANRSPARVQIDGGWVTPYQAGKDFLSTILVLASSQLDLAGEEVALTVPVEAFEHYENWLGSVAQQAGMPRFRLIDEPSAAALGYGARIQPGGIYLIVDFGGGTFHASVIRIESEDAAANGRRCRVLGKAGRDLGGATIDQWIYQDSLRRCGLTDTDESVLRNSTAWLVACQKAKELLSEADQADNPVMTGSADHPFQVSMTRLEFEDLLDRNDLFTALHQTVRSALASAAERGVGESDIRAVLLVGGSARIPSVQRALRQMFGRDQVWFHRPLDAVARGAAAFVAGVDFYDHVQHDYAIRYLDPTTGRYDYRTLVQRGTPYPTSEPVRLTVKAGYEGQTRLGLAIFEIGETRPASSTPFELVFDSSGQVRVLPVTPSEVERRTYFWMNESEPTFLRADPPGRKGEPRFLVEFSVDANKRLLVSAVDLHTNHPVMTGYPVIQLT